MKTLGVGDIEVLNNLFTYTFYEIESKEYKIFVIHKLKNDIKELYEHLNSGVYIIGYNIESYDYPILHHMMSHYHEYVYMDGESIALRLYYKSQTIIDQEFSKISDKNKYSCVNVLDLYTIFHYDSFSRRCSLKHLEISMRMKNVADMPFHHYDYINTWEDIEKILEYNKNDVDATYQFYLISRGQTDHPIYSGDDKIAIRKSIQKKFGINCLNYSDITIGEELALKLYCNRAKKNPYEIRKSGGTSRYSIDLHKCIPEYIKFETPVFQNLLSWFKSKTIYETSGPFTKISLDEVSVIRDYLHHDFVDLKKNVMKSLNIKFQDSYISYGVGGLHQSVSGVFEEDNVYMILDMDVASMHPNIAIKNRYYPEHLGEDFLFGYEYDIVNPRMLEKKKPISEQNISIINGNKLAANAIYGKSNEKNSFLYDPLYTMSTTITSEMVLTMLIEKLVLNVKNVTLLQSNTDGISIKIPRNQYNLVMSICKEWENLTQLNLEFEEYSKMVISDVSNYIAVSTKGKIKLKGDFEIYKEFHKNPSMRIVAIALKKYFLEGIPIETTIKNHSDIFDFCIMARVRRTDNMIFNYIKNKELVRDKISRTQRFYACLDSCKTKGTLSKISKEKKKETAILSKIYVNLFNDYFESNDYQINYNYYIEECNKIINKIEPSKQLSIW